MNSVWCAFDALTVTLLNIVVIELKLKQSTCTEVADVIGGLCGSSGVQALLSNG